MKKCPGCGSISSDEEDKCGVCGESLLDVRPMDESLEQAELEINVKEKADYQRLEREQKRSLHRGAITGLLAGLILILLGGWLLITGIAGGLISLTPNGLQVLVGILLLAFGLVSVESVFGLYEGAPYHGRGPWGGLDRMDFDAS